GQQVGHRRPRQRQHGHGPEEQSLPAPYRPEILHQGLAVLFHEIPRHVLVAIVVVVRIPPLHRLLPAGRCATSAQGFPTTLLKQDPRTRRLTPRPGVPRPAASAAFRACAPPPAAPARNRTESRRTAAAPAPVAPRLSSCRTR